MLHYYLHHKSEAILTYSNANPAQILTTATKQKYYGKWDKALKHQLSTSSGSAAPTFNFQL